MLIHLLPLYLLGILNILLGILVLVRDKKKVSNIAFFGVIASVGVWCIGISGYFTVTSLDAALRWMQIYYIAPLILVYSLVVFAMTFPEKHDYPHIRTLLAVPIAIGVTMIALFPHLLIESLRIIDGQRVVSLFMPYYSIYAAFVIGYFLLGLAILRIRSKERTIVGRQLGVFFIGAFFSTASGLYFNLILPALGDYDLIWIGPATTTIFMGVVSLVMTKYKMFDIRTFVIRTVAYILTMAILAIAYVAPVVFLISKTLDIPFYWTKFVLAVTIATFAAAYFQVFQGWFNRVTNHIFFRDAFDATDALSQLNKTLASSIRVSEIVDATSKVVRRTLRPEYIHFLLKTDGQETFRDFGNFVDADNVTILEDLEVRVSKTHDEIINAETTEPDPLISAMKASNIAIIAKLSAGKNKSRTELGYMIIGPRKSGKMYSGADQQYISTIVSVLTVALQNALHYEEIQQFNETLRQRVDEATKKLKVTNEKLQKMDEAKDEFISMASHQLRTPLTSVKGYVSMVLDGDAGPITDQQRQLLKQSFVSSERMANLISDLLNLSRINTGKFVMELVSVDLRQVITTELEQLRETAESKGLTILYEAPETFPILSLDENKMHQVVMNLVDNAMYYTHEGGTITLTLTETPAAVEFRVIDTGIGVPREDQKHLFGKMYRAENARRARPDGTGLGLFMVKKVIVAQGGAILFDSVEGKGSTFGFRFNKADHLVPTAVSD